MPIIGTTLLSVQAKPIGTGTEWTIDAEMAGQDGQTRDWPRNRRSITFCGMLAAVRVE
jgi:hypothetical protein